MDIIYHHLYNGGLSKPHAEQVRRTLLTAPPENKKIKTEMVAAYLWSADQEHTALRSRDPNAFGAALIELAIGAFDFEVFLLDPAPPEVDRRLKTIVTEYASRVTFAATGDALVRNIVRSKLDAHRIPMADSVFDAFTDQYPGPLGNKLLRPFIDSHPTVLASTLDWDSVDGFLFAVAMLRELTGNGTVVFNHEIVNGGGPAFFVVRGGIDYGFGDAIGVRASEIWIGDTSASLWHFANCVGGEFLVALTDPESLSTSSAFRTFIL